mgnify:CR=1 FL=1
MLFVGVALRSLALGHRGLSPVPATLAGACSTSLFATAIPLQGVQRMLTIMDPGTIRMGRWARVASYHPFESADVPNGRRSQTARRTHGTHGAGMSGLHRRL